tara:strand:+ start:83 stop:1318 length:1236 start_codon:yes stop_codon:yes gene_type:complete
MKENYLKIITNNDNIFHIEIYVPVGSIHEEKGQYGISHFLEHLKFNKSKKFDKTEFINKLTKYTYNATTTLDHTKYFITSTNKNYKDIIDIINQIVFNTSFSSNDIEKERKIVLAEKIYTQQEKFLMEDISIYDKKNPYSRAVIGTTSDINNLKNKDFKKYNEKYLDNYFVFVSCSKNIQKKVKDLCLKKFPNSKNQDIKPLPNIDLFKYELILRNAIDDKQLLIINFKTFSFDDKNYDYLNLVDTIISKGRLSKLVSLLREKKGFVYRVESSNHNFKDNGFYIIKIILNKNENIKNVIKIIFDEFKKIKDNELTNKELENYKKKYIDNFNLKLKDYKYFLDFYSNNLFYKSDFKMENYIKKIKGVEPNIINNIINEVLNFYQMNIVIYGNFKNINKTNESIYKIIEKYRE